MAQTDSDTVNYRGVLYLYGKSKAPFLNAIGARTKRTSGWTFPVAAPWTLSAGAQTTQSEDTAASAGNPTTIAVGQDVNVLQIMKEDISVTFRKQAQWGEMSGANTTDQPAVLDALGFQKKGALMQIAKNMEFSLLQGAYVAVGTSATNTTTRGLKNAITTNTVAGGGDKLSKGMIEEVVREMIASGAPFDSVVLTANAFNMQKISDIYGYAPQDRTVGGVAIDSFLVPGAGVIRVLFSPEMPTDEVYLVEMGVCAPVFNPVIFGTDGNIDPVSNMVNGVDVLFQPVAITAAGRGGFFYTHFGFDHGPEEYHGSITGLATSD
jgi:hypothetical protein